MSDSEDSPEPYNGAAVQTMRTKKRKAERRSKRKHGSSHKKGKKISSSSSEKEGSRVLDERLNWEDEDEETDSSQSKETHLVVDDTPHTVHEETQDDSNSAPEDLPNESQVSEQPVEQFSESPSRPLASPTLVADTDTPSSLPAVPTSDIPLSSDEFFSTLLGVNAARQNAAVVPLSSYNSETESGLPMISSPPAAQRIAIAKFKDQMAMNSPTDLPRYDEFWASKLRREEFIRKRLPLLLVITTPKELGGIVQRMVLQQDRLVDDIKNTIWKQTPALWGKAKGDYMLAVGSDEEGVFIPLSVEFKKFLSISHVTAYYEKHESIHLAILPKRLPAPETKKTHQLKQSAKEPEPWQKEAQHIASLLSASESSLYRMKKGIKVLENQLVDEIDEKTKNSNRNSEAEKIEANVLARILEQLRAIETGVATEEESEANQPQTTIPSQEQDFAHQSVSLASNTQQADNNLSGGTDAPVLHRDKGDEHLGAKSVQNQVEGTADVHPPPPKTPALLQEDKIRMEFFETEEKYFQSLDIIVEVYLKPLAELEILGEKDRATIFSNIITIHQIHQKLYMDLQKVGRGELSFTDSLRVFVPFLKMYTVYINGYEAANAAIQRLIASSKKFAMFVQEAKERPECNSLDLSSYMIMPIQRLPRYELLLRDLIKYTPEDKADEKNKLKDLLQSVIAVNQHVNESKRSQDLREKLYKLQGCVRNQVDLFDRVDRELVREGSLQVSDIKEHTSMVQNQNLENAKFLPHYFFLFDDFLLEVSVAKGDKYKFIHRTDLPAISLSRTAVENVVMLTDHAQHLREYIKGKSAAEIDGWVKEIEKCRDMAGHRSTGPVHVVGKEGTEAEVGPTHSSSTQVEAPGVDPPQHTLEEAREKDVKVGPKEEVEEEAEKVDQKKKHKKKPSSRGSKKERRKVTPRPLVTDLIATPAKQLEEEKKEGKRSEKKKHGGSENGKENRVEKTGHKRKTKESFHRRAKSTQIKQEEMVRPPPRRKGSVDESSKQVISETKKKKQSQSKRKV